MTAGIGPLGIGRNLGFDVPAVTSELAVDALLVLTQLGDTWLLLVLVALFYLFGPDRERGALAVALAVGGLALVVALKSLFALPRPPAELHRYPVEGYGFPSGHALGSTVVWGALAALADRWTRNRRVLAAATVVVVVAATRVLLGVHFVGDVVAGVAAGLAFLAGVLWLARDHPTRAFAIAGVVALGAVALGGGVDAVAALGAATGAGLAWVGLDLEGHSVSLAVAVLGGGVLGSLVLVALAVEPPWPLAFAATLAGAGGIVALPRVDGLVAARLSGSGQYFSR